MKAKSHLALHIATALLAMSSAGRAQVDCNAIPAGPARTDCYIGLGRISGAQSDLAASKVRVQSDAARYRQVTGANRSRIKHRQP